MFARRTNFYWVWKTLPALHVQKQYPQINIVAEEADEQALERGRQQLLDDIGRVGDHEENLEQLLLQSTATNGEPTVAEALNAYEEFISVKFTVQADWEEGLTEKRLSDTGKSYLGQVDDIREFNGNAGHLEWRLSKLSFDGCQAMLDVWRDRPDRKNGTQRASKSCKETIKRFMNTMGFFRWRRVKKLSRTQSAAFHTIYGVTDWRRINRLRLRCFRFRKCKKLLHLTVGGVF
jgi:hypothetical protein